ncbi:MAG: LVIVD repeat-containing protein [Chitinophagaceae bacterium]
MKALTKTLLPVLAAFVLSGCLKDKMTRTYTIFTPVYKNKQDVLREVSSKPARSIESPGKIYVYGNYLFVNEINKGVHVIDNSNPSNPVNRSFINIPGNLDIAVKGNILFADIYRDILAIDISDPLAASITSISAEVFPDRNAGSLFYFIPDTSRYIVDWIKKDTTVPYTDAFECRGCLAYSSTPLASSAVPTVGVAGSMSRFSVVNNYLYTVNTSMLQSFNINNPASPVKVKDVLLRRGGIETIYPFADKLFIGSTSGMLIYDISDPASPVYVSMFSHAMTCDPVITDGDYAYVTLRAGTVCGTTVNSQLNILDIKQIESPKLIGRYDMSSPYGLGKDGNLLWICDGGAGLKMFDASDPGAIKLTKTVAGIEPYDVIPYNGKLIVSAKEGIIQYDYSHSGQLTELSRLKKK